MAAPTQAQVQSRPNPPIMYVFSATVTPDNDNDLTRPANGLWIGGAGSIVVDMLDGSTVTFTGVAAGTLLPVAVRRVRALSTSCTGIVALW